MGTIEKVVIGIALFATFGLFVAIAYAYVTNEASLLEIRRKLRDVGEYICLVCLVTVAIICVSMVFVGTLARNSLLAIRRKLVILVWGYGGDVAEWLSPFFSAASAGIRSQFGLDEEAQEALDV